MATIMGLDLGQSADFTALAIGEKAEAEGQPSRYDFDFLHRWPLKTEYVAIVNDLAKIAKQVSEPMLVVDETGVGRPIVEQIRRHVPVATWPVTITGGTRATRQEDGSWHVPKKALVTNAVVLMESNRLKIAPTLSEARVLVKELQNFRVKVTVSANEVFEAWREGMHDDLVLALCLACWAGEKIGGWGPVQVAESVSEGRSIWQGHPIFDGEPGFGDEDDRSHW
jgi:hypothetical protein